ncbi:MAG: hypothetical protein J1D89_01820 [Agathobacter sp.]|nr:hypothetical protein [Agathobacter sp.]
MRRRRQRGYKFTEKTHSKRGIAATVLSVVLLGMLAAFLYLACVGDGNLSAYYGSAGVFAILLAVLAVLLAGKSLTEEDSFQGFPRMGLFLSLLNAACWIGLYVLGYQQGV